MGAPDEYKIYNGHEVLAIEIIRSGLICRDADFLTLRPKWYKFLCSCLGMDSEFLKRRVEKLREKNNIYPHRIIAKESHKFKRVCVICDSEFMGAFAADVCSYKCRMIRYKNYQKKKQQEYRENKE